MKRVIFTSYARQELEDAVAYYESEKVGLGKRFRDEVKKAALRIAAFPEACSIERGEVRKCLLHIFPYKLLYSIESNHILILAVAHQHRKPNYWMDGDRT